MKPSTKLGLIAAFALLASTAISQVKLPAASPTQTINQDFALSNISITYSRPSVKGREIFGQLVPYGAVWRTGANASTKIKFGEEVSINGKTVPAGEYSLFSIPGANEWTFILSKNLKGWGAMGYNDSEDLLRFTAKPQEIPFSIETFTMLFANQTQNSVDVQLLWDNVSVGFTVKADIDSKVMASIAEGMKGDKKPYAQAATYYFDNGKDLKQALTWASEAVKAQPDAYWLEHLKAKIQLKLGDKKGAIASAESSMKKAEAQKNPDYVALNKKLIASAK
ncbi:DUF2911 domain-containing protein [Desertivirga xinjiangensis]|uniref:DUF2911 domain-containing protein n=1 Tax=Desertivirga xinjiangensis TaxID=539206 RepID=UPI00210E7B4B|nr:DUF2911 domain-containing protein [Pedobacter xinjiangensis]